ncbi:hypothetical protein ACFWAY_16010 [Rhodococcus sp. NPDC059968]|uniref:hypothetical protein n=1 Tax=Rhodococcus sp. NPDC059968 TaxID=3347017 RepID=UPI00366BC522
MAWLLLGVKPYMSTVAVISRVFGSQLKVAVPVGMVASVIAGRACPEADSLGADDDAGLFDVDESEQPPRTSTPAAATHAPTLRSIRITP